MNKEISILLLDRIKAAPYLDRCSGLVQTFEKVIEADGGKAITKRIPVTSFACFADCDGKSQAQVAMVPDSKYKSLLYFEDYGTTPPTTTRAGFEFISRIRLVCWLNTKLIAGQSSMMMSAQIMTDLMTRITAQNPFNQPPFTRINPKVSNFPAQNKDIFSKYDYSEKETQYLMAPFEYFAIDFEVSFVIPASCMLPIDCDTEPCNILTQLFPCLPEPCPGPVLIPGKSAYEVAVDLGFVGDEIAWLLSLIGAKGDKGDTGEPGPQGEQGIQGEQGLPGADGIDGVTPDLSNYYTKTETDTEIDTAIDGLKDGVDVSGDTLKKLKDLIDGINFILTSDDLNLDSIQEIVDKLKSEQDLITALASDKVNVADVVNNLTTTVSGKVLDARQGKALKDLIDALTTTVSSNTSAIAAEVTNRTNADTTLQSNITSEASTRASADTTLQSNITAEATARASADTSLQSQITTNATDIASEAAARAAADALKVTANAAITGATKTKITYDSKGLVTSGADATTADIADSTNKRYVTDANLTTIGNQSGTNTGDETLTSIKSKLGITTLSGSNTGDQDLSGLATTTALSTEATSRANADTTLQSNITAEASTRAAADTTLQSNIDLKQTSLTPIAVKTANYSASANEFVPVDNTSGNITVTLPTAPADKTMLAVKLVTLGGTNTLSIATGGSDVFNKTGGSTSITLRLLNQGILIQYKATGGIWYIIADDTSLTQLDARYLQASNNLSDLASAAAARTNLGLGTLATQSGTFSGTHSGTSSGTNTGDVTADIQVFTSTGAGTWIKPAGAKTVDVVCIGAGGGGGSAAKTASGTACSGGAGGGGGGFSRGLFPASVLGSTVAVNVGLGGTGGASQSTNSTAGNIASNGSASSFGTSIRGQGGFAGGGGQIAGASSVGALGFGQLSGSAGTAGTSGAAGSTQGGSVSGAQGGSSGGGLAATPVAVTGGQVTAPLWTSFSNLTAATGTGSNGADNIQALPGQGGGGGGSSTTGAGNTGGNGGLYGAGGGGGGASLNTGGNSGAGGNGANGIVLVITYF